MATQATPSPATPAPKRTTKAGINLENFEDIIVYKDVPEVSEVTSLDDALGRLGNDTKKLFSIIRSGLQEQAIEAARNSADGWLLMTDDRKPVTDPSGALVPFTGALADAEDVNPVVLQIAKSAFDYDSIDSEDPKSAEKKRESKQAAKDLIKTMPKILDGLKRKAAAKNAKPTAA